MIKIKNWTILTEPFYKKLSSGRKIKYLNVQCTCGNIREMPYQRVYSKESFFKCNSCSSKENSPFEKNKGKASIGDLGGTYFNGIKTKAIKRGIKFLITKEFAWNLFLKQNGKCKLSGIDITLSRELHYIGRKRTPNVDLISASLDRIDSTKDYTEDNVQWVHKWINIMKNSLKNEDFILLCKFVANNNKDNSEPSLENMEFKFSRKVQRLTDEDSISNNSDKSAGHPIVK